MMPFLMFATTSGAAGPQPVAMIEREIGPGWTPAGYDIRTLRIGTIEGTLAIPDGFGRPKATDLWIHFHTAPWFAIQEYERAAVRAPLLVFNLGQGSTTYATPFAGTDRLKPWLDEVERELTSSVNRLHITSFSAGYGAVRNLVQDAAVLPRVGTVILADSLYASLDPSEPSRVVLPAHVKVWDGLRRQAEGGTTTWIVTTSQITPPDYAGTWEVGLALVRASGGSMAQVPVAPGQTQPLLTSYRKGRFFVWSYAGETAIAHMTHPRRLAELIRESRRPD